MNKECKVWTIKDNYRLGDDIQSKVLAFAFGLSAEIEQYQEYGITKYKISFLFLYSKGDTINYVDGRDILI